MSADLCPTTGRPHRTDWGECEHCGYPTPEDRAAVEAMELSPDEGWELFDKRCRDSLNVSGSEFLRAHFGVTGYPASWPAAEVTHLQMLLPFAWPALWKFLDGANERSRRSSMNPPPRDDLSELQRRIDELAHRPRIWFYGPEWYWHGWSTLLPVHRGGDEWDRWTLMFGWPVTGRVVVALW